VIHVHNIGPPRLHHSEVEENVEWISVRFTPKPDIQQGIRYQGFILFDFKVKLHIKVKKTNWNAKSIVIPRKSDKKEVMYIVEVNLSVMAIMLSFYACHQSQKWTCQWHHQQQVWLSHEVVCSVPRWDFHRDHLM